MEKIEALKKDVETLLNNGVELIPIYNIKIGNNSKNAYGKNLPEKWNNPRMIRFNKNKTLEALNNGCCGFFGRAGKRTGYNIIDVDNGRKQTTNPKILIELINKCKFYIKSPNGYHFYFKNTDYFKNKHLGVYGNIDILTNENVHFFGIREDGIYSIVKDENIIKIPDNIINELLEGIKKKTLNDALNIDINDTTETPYKDNETYFITSNELIKLLEDLDKDFNDDTKEWIKISSILKKAGFKDAWKYWSCKSNKYNEKNNEIIFKRLKTNETVPDLNYIIEILNNQSKKKYNIISKIYKSYQPLTDINKSLITKTINEQYLNSNIYENEKDEIIKSSLGTAKTYSTFDYILKNDYKILSICQLINNVDNHIRDFKKHPSNINDRFLLSYNEIPEYELENHFMGYKNTNDDFSNNINGVCSTIDSLANVHKKYFNNNDLIKDYVIFMDEIHSDLLHLLTSTTLNGKRTETISILYEMLKNCKKIILSDGNICDVVLTFYKSLNRSIGYEFISNEYKSFNGVNVYHKSLKCIQNTLDNKVINNTFATIACNTKKQVETTYKYLYELKQKYKKDFKILCYTSTEGEKIEDVNKEWDNAFIIYSPSIISGLDFRSKMPQDVILFIDGKETINAEQMAQQICRNRNIKNVYICCSHYSNALKYNTVEDLQDDYNKRLNDFHSCTVYKQLADKILINQKYEYRPNDFTNLYSMSLFHNNIMSSNILYYIEEILKSYGFIFHNRYSISENAPDEKTNNQPITEEETEPQSIIYDDDEKYKIFCNDVKNGVEIKETKYNKQLMNRFKYINLKMPTSETEKETFLNILDKHNEILSNTHIFNNHMSFIHYIKSVETLKSEFIENMNKDFKEHNMKSKISKLLNIKNIMNKYLPDINVYNFSYNEIDEKYNEIINITNAEYEYIKSFVRTKKDAPKNKKELLSVMIKCYKDIFGEKIFKPFQRKQKYINNKYINYNIITFNDEYFKSHLELFKYSLIYSKSTKDYKTKYDKSICDILDT